MKTSIACVAMGLSCLAQSASAEFLNYYVGLDTRSEITYGTYLGLSNPNQDRLTFLYAHPNEESPESNHFHGIGAHSYEGPVESPTATPTNSNNRLPETYTGQAPLTLQTGSGEYAGKLVSGENGEHYSDLTIANIHDMAGFAEDAPETYMYNSSAMGYQGSLDGVQLGLEVVSITPGLYLGSEGLTAGETLEVGDLTALPFEPVFWTEADAVPGTYSAELRLVDLGGNLQSSGTFNIDFAVSAVPEPVTAWMLGLMAAAVLPWQWRRIVG
ncbi:all3515 family Zur-repressed PEP-CTERM protein [Aeoliella sp. ICT_H6.2]|uniref:All3515 family Zur-repressed PEP-CTERM protein n=1 Tax=Aeoliella straminimaris TaxID=2954799 RepID=A0A9X2FCL0_9BACT|nr:all3515 family Zur-repressed PEP-CTERM protein [Aeoliella straminimaris]MCO6046089.1 all3515 family Zur-repressed PEP-CTERM protein [Aeoliella straminimaris]